MKFVINTGDEFEVRDDSSEGCIIVECSTAVAETIKEKVTTETLKRATLGDATLTDVVLDNICVGESEKEDCFITISCHKKTTDEIILERIKEQSIALAEIAEMVAEG